MERRNEIILLNTILENVLRYLFVKLKGISGETIQTTSEDGTISYYTIQYLFPTNSNKIEVKFTTSVTPQGNIEKSYGNWGDLVAMRFEGLQLQENTVLIKGDCDRPIFAPIFDHYWDDMLKAFGAVHPLTPNSNHSENIIADNQGGTITYKRNEKGQTLITGGAVNPGYYVELGRGVGIKPESQFHLNHTTGSFQPGLYPPQAKDSIIKVTSETLAGMTENINALETKVSAEKRKKPNAQIYQRAMIWRDLVGWMKLGNVTPSPKECIAELKKKPAYRNKPISTKRMKKVLEEGFAGEYDDILKNV